MTKDEFTRKLTKVNQIMNELIFALMQTGMSYRHAEEEIFKMLKRKRSSKETKDDREISVSDSRREHFLVLYEKYQKAKKKNGPLIWARAVLCRKYLQKISDPDKEADIFEEMFAGLTTEEKPAESFRKLCEDSKSYSRNSASPTGT
jgi:hypothetical protein